jgi:O-antigen/teichoic acid export membrane protein
VQHFGVYAWSAVLECVARLLSGALLLLFVPSVHAALLAYVLGLVAAQTAARLHLRSLPAPPPGASVGSASLARFAVPMFALTLLAAGFHSLDMLFVKHRFSAPEAGIYGAAGAAGRVFALLFSPFRVLLLPASSALRAQGRPAEGLLLRASAGFLLLAAVPLVAVAIAPDAIITVVYGERFAPAGALLLLMACSSILGFLPLLIAQALAAAEQWRWLALYALGLAGEWVALLAWGASPDRVVRIALAAKAATCLLLVGYYAAWRPRARLEEPRATTVAEPLGALGRGAWD